MRQSLRWKILVWALFNLVLIAGAVVWFLHAQFQVGIHSLLAGPTGVRLDSIARQLAPELKKRKESEWPAALENAAGDWRKRGVRVALVHNSGRVATGDIQAPPTEVLTAIRNHNAKMGVRPGGPMGKGGPPMRMQPGNFPKNSNSKPPKPPADGFLDDGPGRGPDFADKGPGKDPGFFDRGPPDKPGFNGNFGHNDRAGTESETPTFEKFMLISSAPRTYWAGVHLDNSAGPLPYTLLLSSDSIRGGGLFFDYVPWLWLGTGLTIVSLLLWLPMVHVLTQTLKRLTASAEHIASGVFEAPPGTKRRDELGRLQNAHRHMARRLDGFVTGQKRFLGDTAHELLSPLARLEVSLSILEQRVQEKDRGTVNRALEETHHIASLVRELLDFSKSALVSPGTVLEPVPLNELVRQSIRREAGEVNIDVGIDEGIKVMASPALLERAVGNVIRNAIRYAGNDGPIRVTAGVGKDYAVLRMIDSGPGVPEESLPNLFDPFFRPDVSRTTATGGSGLGLAIVKTCIETCHGRVLAKNIEPVGFMVEITLPTAN